MSGRPQIPLGGWGKFNTKNLGGGKWNSQTRFRNHDGSFRKISASGPSAVKAENALKAKVLAEQAVVNAGGDVTRSMRMNELIDKFIHDLKYRDIIQNTRNKYAQAADKIIRPEFRLVQVGEMTAGRCERFLQRMQDTKPGSLSQSRTVLGLIMKPAVRDGVFHVNPVYQVPRATRPRSKFPRALTPEEVKNMRKAMQEGGRHFGPAPDDRLISLFEILISTGCRIGEVLALRRCDVDVDTPQPCIRIVATLTRDENDKAIRGDKPKTVHSKRTLAITGRALEAVRTRLANIGKDNKSFLFETETKTLWDPAAVRTRWRKAMREANLEPVNPHVLRATVATFVAERYGIQAAAALLGHSSVAITEKFYIDRPEAVPFGIATAMEDFGKTPPEILADPNIPTINLDKEPSEGPLLFEMPSPVDPDVEASSN